MKGKKNIKAFISMVFLFSLAILMLWACTAPNNEDISSKDILLNETPLKASSSDYIIVYDAENYGGTSRVISANTAKLSDIGWDNRIKSVRTYGNCLAVLFEDNYFSNASSVNSWDQPWGDGARYVDTNGSDPGTSLGYMSGKASSISILWKGANGSQPGCLKEDVAITGRNDSTDVDNEWKLYLSTDTNLDPSNPPVTANRYQKGPWEEFEIYWLDKENKYFALKSKTNGLYVTCDFNRSNTDYKAKLVARSSAIRLWEMFAIQDVKAKSSNYIYSRISPVRYVKGIGTKPARNETFLGSAKRCDSSVINQSNDIGVYGWVGDYRAYLFRIQKLAPVQSAPLTIHPYTADPSAHVFDGKIYIYPSHDTDIAGGFKMVDYYVYSMDSITSPLKHYYEIGGPALKIEPNSWYNSQLWAPDAAKKGSTYYFYFPAKAKEQVNGNDVFRIGVATSSSPYGPFTAEASYITGNGGNKSYSIDQCIFDYTGTGTGPFYMYFGGLWGGQLEKWSVDGNTFNPNIPDQQPSDAISCRPRVAIMSADLKSFYNPIREIIMYDTDGKTEIKAKQTDRRFFEGGWMNKVGSTFYFSYSTGDTRNIAYATGTSPYGPFTYKGLIGNANDPWNYMNGNDSPYGWTTHHSIVQIGSNWYIFYHDNELSGHGLEKRSIKFKQITFPPQ